jgi:hypothetical protein
MLTVLWSLDGLLIVQDSAFAVYKVIYLHEYLFTI